MSKFMKYASWAIALYITVIFVDSLRFKFTGRSLGWRNWRPAFWFLSCR